MDSTLDARVTPLSICEDFVLPPENEKESTLEKNVHKFFSEWVREKAKAHPFKNAMDDHHEF